jgi:hypothetical protein
VCRAASMPPTRRATLAVFGDEYAVEVVEVLG